ncbi:MAG: hypothetical protein ABFD54_02100 [Armatimonadota bacterium]|nr:hypothetical protein [bacterium]
MVNVDKEWVKKQLDKAISAEQSIIESEKDHRDKLAGHRDLSVMYDRIIQDDEKHLDELKGVGRRYGIESSKMEGAGRIAGRLKGMAEGMVATDSFQDIGDDLAMKATAVNNDIVWKNIFSNIGDLDSANAMDRAAAEDEQHEMMIRNTLTSVGVMEAHGEMLEEE